MYGMGEIRIIIRTDFGKVEVAGRTFQEVLRQLEVLRTEYSLISRAPTIKRLRGIIEMTAEGPIIVTKKRLTHYEAIALILYFLENRQCSLRRLRNLLISSGKKITLPARLHEMKKRGLVIKPHPRVPEYKLSLDGVRWVEEEVLPRLKTGM